MYDLKVPEGVMAHMSHAKSPQDWDERVIAVKAANGGDYPEFWWSDIVVSGFANTVLGSGAMNVDIASSSEKDWKV